MPKSMLTATSRNAATAANPVTAPRNSRRSMRDRVQSVARFRLNRTSLNAVAGQELALHGKQDDLEIEEQREILDIGEIVVDTRAGDGRIMGGTPQAVGLGPSG